VRYQQPERRTISSVWTHFYRFVLPIIWIGIVGLPAFGKGSQALWFVLPLMIFGAGMIYVLVRRLTTVRVDDKAVYVSTWCKETRVPFSEIDDVVEIMLFPSMNPVALSFRTGRRIVFLPAVRWLSLFGGHPIVDELRDLVRRNAAR
jgi:hypothetical protein